MAHSRKYLRPHGTVQLVDPVCSPFWWGRWPIHRLTQLLNSHELNQPLLNQNRKADRLASARCQCGRYSKGMQNRAPPQGNYAQHPIFWPEDKKGFQNFLTEFWKSRNTGAPFKDIQRGNAASVLGSLTSTKKIGWTVCYNLQSQADGSLVFSSDELSSFNWIVVSSTCILWLVPG